MPRLTKEQEDQYVQAVLAGDGTAFTPIYNALHPMVRSQLRRMNIPFSDIDDYTQDIFLRAFDKLHQFKAESRLTTWLGRIAVNYALMRVRSNRSRIERNMLSIDTVYDEQKGTWEPGIDIGYEDPALRCNLDVKIMLEHAHELPTRMRNVLTLRLNGESFADIAEQQGRSIPAVKSDVQRCMKFLRDRMLAVETEAA